jgi:hypothetical protein
MWALNLEGMVTFKLAGCLFINLASKQKLAFIGNIVNLLLGLFLAVTNPKA